MLALQGAFREHCRALEQVGLEAVEVRRADHLPGLTGLVLPGGESTTMSKLIDAYGLEPGIRELHAVGAPLLATCAGMILVARAAVDGTPDQRHLGLIDITVRRNAFGRQVASFESPLAVSGLDEPVTAVFIRAPWIESAGPGVELLAEYQGRPVAARQGSVLVTAFHPELTDDRRLHRLFAGMVERSRQEAAA